MPFARLTTAAAVVAALAVTPAAAAPVCHLVSDAAGDHMVFVSQSRTVLTTDVDITSADIAIGKNHVVAAIRLVSLRRLDPRSPEPKQYLMSFTLDGGGEWSMVADVSSSGVTGEVMGPDYTYFPATVALDHVRREVRIAAAAKHFGKPQRATVGGITATAGPYVGVTNGEVRVGPLTLGLGSGFGFGWPADTATTDRTYRGGTPTCVPMPS